MLNTILEKVAGIVEFGIFDDMIVKDYILTGPAYWQTTRSSLRFLMNHNTVVDDLIEGVLPHTNNPSLYFYGAHTAIWLVNEAIVNDEERKGWLEEVIAVLTEDFYHALMVEDLPTKLLIRQKLDLEQSSLLRFLAEMEYVNEDYEEVFTTGFLAFLEILNQAEAWHRRVNLENYWPEKIGG